MGRLTDTGHKRRKAAKLLEAQTAPAKPEPPPVKPAQKGMAAKAPTRGRKKEGGNG